MGSVIYKVYKWKVCVSTSYIVYIFLNLTSVLVMWNIAFNKYL